MQHKTRAMVEVSLLIALISVFTIIGTYIPVLTFIIFFLPTPFIILGKRHGMYYIGLAILIWTMITGSFIGPIESIFLSILMGGTAAIMAYLMKKDASVGKILAGGTFVCLIGMVLSIQLSAKVMGIDLISQMKEAFEQSMNMQMSMYETVGMEKIQLEQLKKTLEMGMQMLVLTIPGAIIISSTILPFANYTLTCKILKKLGYETKALPPLKYVRLPKSFLMGTFLIIGLTMLTRYFNFVNYQSLVVNVFLILQLVYFIQGIAVMSYFFHALKMSKPVKILLYILILFSGKGIFLLATVGFIDCFMDLRKLKTRN
ncbi:YybS family protein [Inediibacterium massiliense]|uniref:YybS family protein n=1 Tax=Inediibacterium massiliense TaxID=1658111 RepID=UPI0018FED84B|nr:YybS family protein [Inediibacterium massiliense]